MSIRILSFCVASLALVPTKQLAAQRPAPRERVQRAMDALGGEAAARGVNSLTYEYVSVTYQLGQEETPLSPPRGTIQNGRLVLDFANNRRMQDQEVRPATATTLTGRQRRITLRDVSMLEVGGAQQSPETPAQLAATQAALRLVPHRLLLAALDQADALSAVAPRVLRGDSLEGVRYASGADTASLYFDRITGGLVAVETITDDPVLGDRRTTTIYTRWTPSGAITFPRQIDVTVNGRASAHTNVFSASTNEGLTDAMFAIPDSIVERARRPAPTVPVVVNLVELGAGVWRAEGGSHHTLVVEQPRGLVLVEAPQNRMRMAAVFDTLKSRFASKPVQAVVSTHHHWDHSGGLRETMARGIPVITHVRNVSFVRGVAMAPKTVAPDALTRMRRLPYVRSVRDTLTIGSGASRVLLYALPTAHVEGMLAAYVPSAGVLFTSDVVSPGAANAPLPALGSRELDRLARARGITPRRYAGGHGRVVEWEEIRRAASP